MDIGFLTRVAIISVVLVMCAILALFVDWRRRMSRKEKKLELGDERDILRIHAEYVPLLDTGESIPCGPSSRQPPQRNGLATQEDLTMEHAGDFMRQPTPIFTDPETENGDELTQQETLTSVQIGVEVQASNTVTRLSPPRLSIVIPDANHQGQFSTTRPDPMYYTPPPAYHPTSSAGDRASQPSAIIPSPIHPASARLALQSAHQHMLSGGAWASLPGTARSTSPPAYSALLQRTTRASLHGMPNYREGVRPDA